MLTGLLNNTETLFIELNIIVALCFSRYETVRHILTSEQPKHFEKYQVRKFLVNVVFWYKMVGSVFSQTVEMGYFFRLFNFLQTEVRNFTEACCVGN